MRTPIIAGNWKMHKTVAEAVTLVNELKPQVAGVNGVEVVVCPTFTALDAVAKAIEGTNIALGAQNMYWEEKGAFTGEISPVMLKEIGCKYVILGHSERRQFFGETDETVNKKVKAAFAHGLIPIMCVGELLEEREAGVTEKVVKTQTEGGLAGLSPDLVKQIVIAYEPVWAIGTGKTASSQDAQQVIAYIRQVVAGLYGPEVAAEVRIQYGGSVKADNSGELMAQPDIDGALVGGAALEAGSFGGIVRFS
ncbi:MAG: triose-phosphate isomerase [Desulfitobacterium hafniense]|nr:triose-phosphate isomerase [Desulfitobacterium hafniense]